MYKDHLFKYIFTLIWEWLVHRCIGCGIRLENGFSMRSILYCHYLQRQWRGVQILFNLSLWLHESIWEKILLHFTSLVKDQNSKFKIRSSVTAKFVLLLYHCRVEKSHKWKPCKSRNIFFINFYWSIDDLQCCVSFCCTEKWISYAYTCIYLLFCYILFLYRSLKSIE